MIPSLLTTLAVALTVPGFVLAVRALPWVDRQVQAGIKPWACDICMCFWSTAGFTAGVALGTHDLRLLLCAGPAYTVALVVLSFMERPTSAPPIPPPPPPVSGLAEDLEP